MSMFYFYICCNAIILFASLQCFNEDFQTPPALGDKGTSADHPRGHQGFNSLSDRPLRITVFYDHAPVLGRWDQGTVAAASFEAEL